MLSLHDALPIACRTLAAYPIREIDSALHEKRTHHVDDDGVPLITLSSSTPLRLAHPPPLIPLLLSVIMLTCASIAEAQVDRERRTNLEVGQIGRAPYELQSLMRISYAVF